MKVDTAGEYGSSTETTLWQERKKISNAKIAMSIKKISYAELFYFVVIVYNRQGVPSGASTSDPMDRDILARSIIRCRRVCIGETLKSASSRFLVFPSRHIADGFSLVSNGISFIEESVRGSDSGLGTNAIFASPSIEQQR